MRTADALALVIVLAADFIELLGRMNGSVRGANPLRFDQLGLIGYWQALSALAMLAADGVLIAACVGLWSMQARAVKWLMLQARVGVIVNAVNLILLSIAYGFGLHQDSESTIWNVLMVGQLCGLGYDIAVLIHFTRPGTRALFARPVEA